MNINTKTKSTRSRLTSRRRLIGDAGVVEIRKALKALGRHQLRRAGQEHPQGDFSGPDRIWTPTPEEDAGHIIGRIARPSPDHASNYRDACMSLGHCEALEGLNGDAGHKLTLAIRAEAVAFGVYLFTPGAVRLTEFVMFLKTLALDCAIPEAVAPTTPRKRL
ncbi:hypothetical protein [Xanthomonas sp. NCPPB 2632]|uniref:hypothetical protein n=1 Tax=Xanthomonas sp. NCPPB 2632 TaxID=3240912 RepID=UPI0035131052